MINRARLIAALALIGVTSCLDWEKGLAVCRDAGGCRSPAGGNVILITEPAWLDAGGVVPTETRGLPFVVRNTGTDEAPGVTLFDPTVTDFSVSGPCSGATVAPNATCLARLDFSPKAVGPVTAQLRIGVAGVDPTEIPVFGLGIVPLAIDPAQADLGAVALSMRSSRSFVLKNRSTVRASGLLSFMLDGGVSGSAFAIDAGSCVGTLPASAQCSFEAIYAPTALGSASAQVRVSTATVIAGRPAEAADLALSGEGTPGLGMAPDLWRPAIERNTNLTQQFILSNAFTAPVGPVGISLTPGGGPFSFDAGTCAGATLTTNGSCAITVTYAPTLLGPANAQLIADLPSGRVVAGLFGTSNNYLTLSVSPPPVGGALQIADAGLDCPAGACSVRLVAPVPALKVTARPQPGFAVRTWVGLCSTTDGGEACNLPVLNADASFGAIFWQPVPVGISTTNGKVVMLQPLGSTCSGYCDAGYDLGERLVLSAVGLPGYTLQAWGGDCAASLSDYCLLSIDGPKNVQATFVPGNVAFIGGAWEFTSPGPASADQHCRALADDAGLPEPSSYVSLLSGADRIPDRSWIRSDGKPIAGSRAEIFPDGGGLPHFRYLINGSSRGEIVPTGPSQLTIFTGTRADGTPASSCTGWSGSGPVTYADGWFGDSRWVDFNTTSSCVGPSGSIYCFGTWDAGFYRAPQVPPGARRAFVTTAAGNGAASLAAIDAICAAEAQDAGLSGTFLGARSDQQDAGANRFAFDAGGWFRTDGVALFPWAPDLRLSGKYPAAPLNIGANGLPVAGLCVWTGSLASGVQGTAQETCSNWSLDAGGSPRTAGYQSRIQFWSSGITTGCSAQCHFYCFEP